jgi:hypothetical protein
MNRKIISRICEIFDEELMCSPEDFSVENYNRFEEKIWNLKKLMICLKALIPII